MEFDLMALRLQTRRTPKSLDSSGDGVVLVHVRVGSGLKGKLLVIPAMAYWVRV